MTEGARDTADAEAAGSILLLVESPRNRELLAGQLDEEYDVRIPAGDPFEDAQFDLCLIDTPSLRTTGKSLQATKAAAVPTFLPVLLLTSEGSPDDLSHGVWDTVDEVLHMPISRAELDARVENLLGRRRLSVELTRHKEQSERRFRALFQSTPDPVVVVTPDGIVSEANDGFIRTFGVDPEEIADRPVTDLQFSSPEPVERVLLRVEDEDEPSTTTVEWHREGGTPLVTELNADVVTGLGEAAERIGIFRDVTERAERTAELERQNERLEEFARTIAHDLQNPLTIAQGGLEIARETGEREHFEAIATALDRMDELIGEILTHAKQGLTVTDPDPVSVADAVEQAWAHVETRDASLETDLGYSTEIMADEGRLQELFENLFRNAVSHGGRSVTIRVGTLQDDSGFHVEDDGPGIPPELHEKVFEAGYTDAEDGTGFGLSIVQQIVRGHDWEISLTDSEGGGARFEIVTSAS
ncbi:PAS domain-containing sensor histidine kinase [Halobacteriales archaeon QS_4_69_34]|nr:MAG: PAS domain-containing sensor histidine kinase [Halobacteriales archaeon QS_4_69_34]